MMQSTLEQRIWGKVEADDSGCLVWSNYIQKNGYAKVLDNRKWKYAHRVVYELFYGEIPQGLVVDHLCSNRRCVNPAHLEPVTHLENVRRAAHTRWGKKNICIRGHSLLDDDGNVYIDWNGNRQCRLCTRIRKNSYYHRNKDK